MKNVTITLDEKVAHWARVEAAKSGMSLSRWIGTVLAREIAGGRRAHRSDRGNECLPRRPRLARHRQGPACSGTNFMTDLLFADTNILVYAMDPSDPGKRARAKAFLTSAAAKGVLVTSPQTITECYRVLAERRRLLDHHTARRFLATFEWTCTAPLDWRDDSPRLEDR